MKRVYLITILLGVLCLSSVAQEDQSVMLIDTLEIRDGGQIVYKADTILYQTEEDLIRQKLNEIPSYSELSDDALLPITRDQAEELITAMIVEARKPYVEARHRDEVIRKFKVEKLKERMLDQALGATYTDPLKERIATLERLVYALILTGDKKVDPEVLKIILSDTGSSNPIGQPLYQYLVDGRTPAPVVKKECDKALCEKHLSEKGSAEKGSAEKGSAEKQMPKPKRVEHKPLKSEEAIAISPSAPSDKMEYFMSQVFFDFDSAKLSSQDEKVLDNVAMWMKGNKLSISLRGYASLEGRVKYNNQLSARRVKAVADYLISQGIATDRIEQIPSGIDSIKEEKGSYPDARRVDIRPVLYEEK